MITQLYVLQIIRYVLTTYLCKPFMYLFIQQVFIEYQTCHHSVVNSSEKLETTSMIDFRELVKLLYIFKGMLCKY